MKRNFLSLFIIVSGCMHAQLTSPSDEFLLNFQLDQDGRPQYEVVFKGQKIINWSSLGFVLSDGSKLLSGFSHQVRLNPPVNETWKPVLGEVDEIVNHYHEMEVALTQKITQKVIILRFRAFDDGIAFRYEFPQQKNLNYFVVKSENTEFNLTDNHNTFWIPGDFDSQEYAYNHTRISAIDVDTLDLNNGVGFKGPLVKNRVQSPLMMKTDDATYINIFEAAVINYPVMHLLVDQANYAFTADLPPNAVGDAAYLQTPCHTPWRTIMVSKDARTILSSKMILNLNEPSQLTDTSWIKPMKYIGIWWEMHIGKATWDYAGSQNAQNTAQLQPTGRHGATTENTKRYINFAAKHGFDGVLIEGWNKGWEDWFGNWKEEVFDFTTPYPDFNIEEVTSYAQSKNIKLIMHHETSAAVTNYERRLDRAFDFMKKYNYPAVKTGYVGRIIPRGEWHDGQWMVNHYHYVVARAAEKQIMVNSHESSRPTGVHRTWPNYIAAEAARGNEFNAWSVGNPPMHETILPFTRLLGGPMDYTPGIFEIKMSSYDANKKEQVHTTLAKQLALYVTIYSPLQMAADLPENYEKHLDAFQFIKDVAVNWSDTQILEAEPGDYLTIARRAKNSENWFVGAITDENTRVTNLPLQFLKKGKNYLATIYEDAPDAHWQNNPKAYNIRKINVNSKSTLKLNLAAGGGAAVSIIPKEK
jgi:hypothetical protein